MKVCKNCNQYEQDCECYEFVPKEEVKEEDVNKGGFLGCGFEYVAGDPEW